MNIQSIRNQLAERQERRLALDDSDDGDPWSGIADTLEIQSGACTDDSCASQFAAAEARLSQRGQKMVERQIQQNRARQAAAQFRAQQRPVHFAEPQSIVAHPMGSWPVAAYAPAREYEAAPVASPENEPAPAANPGYELDAYGNPVLPEGTELDVWGNLVYR